MFFDISKHQLIKLQLDTHLEFLTFHSIDVQGHLMNRCSFHDGESINRGKTSLFVNLVDSDATITLVEHKHRKSRLPTASRNRKLHKFSVIALRKNACSRPIKFNLVRDRYLYDYKLWFSREVFSFNESASKYYQLSAGF